MSKLFPAFLVLAVLSSFTFSQQSHPCGTSKDIRIVKDKPTVYITFERFGKAVNLSEQRMIEPGKFSNLKEGNHPVDSVIEQHIQALCLME
jgi:hypothetical protein